MRAHRSLISAALAAALLLGQWLGAGHDADHGLKPGAHACAVCVYTHSGGAGLLPAANVLVFAGPDGTPEAAVAAHPLAATLRHHPIRGPPALLV